MSTITAWAAATPELLLAAAVVVLPGLAIALALGFRREQAVGAAPALSVGALSIANVVSMLLKVHWGLAVVAVVTLVLAGLGAGVWATLLRRRQDDRLPEPRWGWGWSAGFVAAAVLVSGFAIARGIGAPESISQTFDSALHVNGIANVVAHQSAAPSVVGAAAAPAGHAGFYPPMFHGIAALVAMTLGCNPIVAANVVAVVLAAVMWPLSMMLLVRTIVGPSRFALAMSMGAVCVISVFPAMLVSYGVLWPNALSYSILPGALALGILVVRQTPFRWVGSAQATLALGIVAPGLYYSHPGAAFALLAIGLPVLAAAELGLLRDSWGQPRRRAVAALLLVVTVVALWGLWLALYHVPALNGVRHFYWSPRQSVSQAVGEALFLTSSLSGDVAAIGALVLLGVLWSLMRGSRLWLVAAHGIIVALYVIATTTDADIRPTLTGFWYNDGFRIAALLPVTGIPLAAIGALWLRDGAAARVRDWASRGPLASRDRVARTVSRRSSLVAALVVAILTVALLPGSTPVSGVVATVRFTYAGSPDQLVSPDEAALFRKIAGWSTPGTEILGSPWTGGVYAGVLSGRQVVFPHMVTTDDPPRTLLMRSFDKFTTDPAVCRAVKSLRIGIVVDDSHKFDAVVSKARIAQYPGLGHLASTPGLTVLGRSATATVYRVGTCSAG